MKLHPLSAVTRSLQRGLVATSLVFFLLAISDFVPLGIDRASLLFLFPVAFALGVTYQVAYYYRFAYRLTTDTLDIDSGVFGRQEREIPYRRVQNVDITESLFHRLFGVAVVRVETAGGSQTEAELNFVDADEAQRLQREIRERRAAATGEARTETPDTESTPADRTESRVREEPATGDVGPTPETEDSGSLRTNTQTQIFSLDSGELALFSLASFQSASILFLIFGFPLVEDFVFGTVTDLLGIDSGPAGMTGAPDFALVVGIFLLGFGILTIWVLSSVLTFIEYYDFTLGRQGEDLVYERGLLQKYSGSIPTDKIQTVTLTENVLMRRFGYAGLSVETAGYSPGQQDGRGGPQAAIPLAARERTLSLARDLEPFGDLELTRPPKRARRRYAARYLIAVGVLTGLFVATAWLLDGFTFWFAPLVLVPVVPFAAHYKWKHRGYAAGEEFFLIRTGFWHRNTRIVPYYRLQTVIRERSIFQRRLGLAHLTADTATSSLLGRRDATAFDIDDEEAVRLYEQSRERLQASLGVDR